MKKGVAILGGFTLISSGVLVGCDDGHTTTTNAMTKADKAYESCSKWEYNKKDESEKCVDSKSNYHGAYLFGGTYFPNHNSMVTSQKYGDNVNKKTGTLKKSSTYSSKYSGSGKSKTYSSGSKSSKIKSSGSAFKSGLGTGGTKGGA